MNEPRGDDDLTGLGPAERELALRLRKVLRAAESTDAATAGRLAAARARAIDAAAGQPRARPRWLWASGGLTAAAIVAALLVQLRPDGGPLLDSPEGGNLDALEVLTDDVDPDFYEDLELYRWLSEEGANGTA